MENKELRIIGWIDSLCDGCAATRAPMNRNCTVIETPKGTEVLCNLCKAQKYPGVK